MSHPFQVTDDGADKCVAGDEPKAQVHADCTETKDEGAVSGQKEQFVKVLTMQEHDEDAVTSNGIKLDPKEGLRGKEDEHKEETLTEDAEEPLQKDVSKGAVPKNIVVARSQHDDHTTTASVVPVTKDLQGALASPLEEDKRQAKMVKRLRPMWKFFVAVHSTFYDTFVVTMRARFPEKKMKFDLNKGVAGYVFMYVLEIPTFDDVEEFLAQCRLLRVGDTTLHFSLAKGTNPIAFVDYIPMV